MKDQFPFTPGIACVDDFRDILAPGKLKNLFQTVFRLLDGFQFKLPGDDGQIVEFPRQGLSFFRHGFFLFQQMTYGRGDDGPVILVKCPGLVPGEFSKLFAEHSRQISGDARLFCYN